MMRGSARAQWGRMATAVTRLEKNGPSTDVFSDEKNELSSKRKNSNPMNYFD